MEKISSASNLAILGQSPLILLGMEQFIMNMQLGYRCVLKTPSWQRLQQQMAETVIKVLVVELSGPNEALHARVKQLLILSEQSPSLNIIIYTACYDVAILAPLHAKKTFSLVAQQGSAQQINQDIALALVGVKTCSPYIKNYFNHAEIARKLERNTLTIAERKVLTQLFAGLSLTEIAKLCHRSIKTISAHKCNGMRKLGVRSDAELFQLPQRDIVLADNRPNQCKAEPILGRKQSD